MTCDQIVPAKLCGLSPEAMLQAFEVSRPELPALERWCVFHFNNREVLQRMPALPHVLLGAWFHYLSHLGDRNVFDLAWSLTGALPSGRYGILALERSLRRVLNWDWRSEGGNRASMAWETALIRRL